MVNIVTPYLSPYIWLPQRCSRGTKNGGAHKKFSHKNVLTPWYPISYLTIASSGFFWGALTGPYPTLWFGGACGLGVGAFDQGGTFDYIIALLEQNPGSPTLTFDKLYVMFTRVKKACKFRCLPFSPAFNKASYITCIQKFWQQNGERILAEMGIGNHM